MSSIKCVPRIPSQRNGAGGRIIKTKHEIKTKKPAGLIKIGDDATLKPQ